MRRAAGRCRGVGGGTARALAAACLAAACVASGLPAVVAAGAEPAADPSQLVLRDGFEDGRLSPGGGLFFKAGPEQNEAGLSFQGRDAGRGRGAVTLSVVPACGSSIEACSERAEIWERPDVLSPYDSTVWYGFAMKLEDPVPQDDLRYVMAQWKREILPEAMVDYSPFLALRLYQGHLGVTVETDRVASFPIGGPERPKGCLPGEARVLDRPLARQTRALVALETGTATANYPAYFDSCAPAITVIRHADLPPAQKGWIDFVFRSQPGPEGAGHVEIVADGVPVATVKGAIGHRGTGLDKNQYFKFGPYRAPNPLPWRVSYDDFRRGPRCEDVIRGGQCPPP